MIQAMRRARVLGPLSRLEATLGQLQDLGFVHLVPPPRLPALTGTPVSHRQRRLTRQLRSILADAETALTLLSFATPGDAGLPPAMPWAEWARRARRARRGAQRLHDRRRALEEEQALLGKYREMLAAFAGLFTLTGLPPGLRAYHAVLRAGQSKVVEQLRKALADWLGSGFELRTRQLSGGETALLLLVPSAEAARVDRLLSGSGVQEVPLPAGYEDATASEALPRMQARLQALPGLLTGLEEERRVLADAQGPELVTIAASAHDTLSLLNAAALAASTRNAFVLEGWVLAPQLPILVDALRRRLGPEIAVEDLGGERWSAEAPVVLHNPRLFRPFQLLVELLPLPRYGSIDPTPFVAVFFPMFFGLMVGDVGYGLVLALVGAALHRRFPPGKTGRAIGEIAVVCAAFTIIFGFLFGELFGDLGRRWLGLRPLLMDREEPQDIVSFLILCLGLGGVHVLLGLVLGVISGFHGHGRLALGRGLSAAMILLIAAALLAALEVLPRSFLTPAVVALLVAFPVLVVVEGIVAPVELLSTLGNILSYARIMALGTASVMLAVVANRLAGALGSALVGAVFGLLFHLVNFVLALFSPTIHGLRLHYVEFFGHFYSPGGVQYRPFGHWRMHGCNSSGSP